MSKTRSRGQFQCSECGWHTTKWVGRCADCQAWGSVNQSSGASTVLSCSPAVSITEVEVAKAQFDSSGVPELDRVLGGGLVPGAVILLAGEPGVGKSTLLLEVAARTAQRNARVLYVAAEESASQVRLRADRTSAVRPQLYLSPETDLETILAHVQQVQPQLLVIDSVQTISASGTEGVAGGMSQVKEVAAALVRTAKAQGIATVLVGHVTKDGSIAGPRVLEHLVDVVLQFEGERTSRFRTVRAVKNRFGPVAEVGCFDLTGSGISAVSDPTGLFLETQELRVPGTCVAVVMAGRRPLLNEVQALTTVTAADRPRRTASGIENSRLALVLAVLAQHGQLRLHHHDVFAATVGGARLTEPAGDLALLLALASASTGKILPERLVAIGEIGLAGELRRVPDLSLRLAEAARLGFRRALVPTPRGHEATVSNRVGELSVTPVNTISEALTQMAINPSADRKLAALH
jgi:DNA repair protein RadA/Sms